MTEFHSFEKRDKLEGELQALSIAHGHTLKERKRLVGLRDVFHARAEGGELNMTLRLIYCTLLLKKLRLLKKVFPVVIKTSCL